MRIRRITVAAVFLLSALAAPLVAEEPNEEQTAKFFLTLHEQVLSGLLENSPPSDLFTFALAYDDRGEVFKALPKSLETKLLAINGVDPKLFVPSDQLLFPYQQKHEKGADGRWTGVAVVKKGTDKRVAVYYVHSINWRGDDGIVVNWLASSGSLAGFGGEDLFQFRDGAWRRVKTLKAYDR